LETDFIFPLRDHLISSTRLLGILDLLDKTLELELKMLRLEEELEIELVFAFDELNDEGLWDLGDSALSQGTRQTIRNMQQNNNNI
jgi:hypothetical protein